MSRVSKKIPLFDSRGLKPIFWHELCQALIEQDRQGMQEKAEDRITALADVRWKAADWIGSLLISLEILGHIMCHKFTGRP